MLWRVSPRSRRSKPAGFIVPAQPALVARPPTGPDWIHEVKHDGYRLIARKEAGRVILWTRHGTDFTDRLPRIAEAVRSLPVDSVLIDGEAVVFRPDGHSDFESLRTKRGAERATFVAFDLLNVEGEDFRKSPLEVRRAELETLTEPNGASIFSEAIESEGAIVFAKACELGIEGIVSKRLGVYWSGPWSKTRLSEGRPTMLGWSRKRRDEGRRRIVRKSDEPLPPESAPYPIADSRRISR